MFKLFTSESVTEGHPDKVADAISDAVLDAMLAADPASRSAVETLVANGVVVVTGEATTEAYVDIQQLARERLLEIGFDAAAKGIDGASCGVMVSLNNQSPDIAMGVSGSWEARKGQAVDAYDLQGAGDQGMMFGYACDETPELMPAPIRLAHRLAEQLTKVRRTGVLGYLRPDGKTQVTVEYDQHQRPVAVNTLVISAQHRDDIDVDTRLDPDLRREVLAPVLEETGLAGAQPRVLINPTGRFVTGGPASDSGLTGRKIIVDTYGGMARHGGGAFSGKDPSKVDRSASYAMRWVAKNVVAAGLARRCEVGEHAIGSAHPTSLYVDTFGTGVVPDSRIADAVTEVFRPPACHHRGARPATADLLGVHLLWTLRPRPADHDVEKTNRVDELARHVKG